MKLDLSPADRRIRHHLLAQATDLNLVPGVKVDSRRPNYPKRINHESLVRIHVEVSCAVVIDRHILEHVDVEARFGIFEAREIAPYPKSGLALTPISKASVKTLYIGGHTSVSRSNPFRV